MIEDPRFTDVYNQRRRETEILHTALKEYLDSESATIKDIADKHGLTLSRLAKHATIHIKAGHRRWAGKGRAPMEGPPDDIKQMLLDALNNGHPYATLVYGITPQMSRYYRYRWRDWLISEGHMKDK
jgi:hypothetical protein